jgi:hypothetical protein
MAIVWNISQLDRKTTDGFVTCAHWNVYAEDGVYKSTAYGTCNWEEGELITPYPDLTEEQVLGWVWEQVSKPDTEAMLLEQIELQKHPVEASGVPW